MGVLGKLKNYLRKSNEKRYLNQLRARLTNKDCTIVCNNCVGGVIYHNLGLQFLSPTVNLFIKGEEYLEFCKNFEYYSHCELVPCEEQSIDYPVGIIVPNDEVHMPIHVYFQHYKTFEDAKEKWTSRYARVNWNNVVYLWEFYDTLYDNRLMEQFDQLEGLKKLLIVHRSFENLKNTAVVTCYDNDQPTARILQYDGITGKRFLEEFDYVSFLNGTDR